MNLNISL